MMKITTRFKSKNLPDSINSWLTVGLSLWRLVKPLSHFLR